MGMTLPPVLQGLLQITQNRRLCHLAAFAVLREYDYGRFSSIEMTHCLRAGGMA